MFAFPNLIKECLIFILVSQVLNIDGYKINISYIKAQAKCYFNNRFFCEKYNIKHKKTWLKLLIYTEYYHIYITKK